MTLFLLALLASICALMCVELFIWRDYPWAVLWFVLGLVAVMGLIMRSAQGATP